MREGAVWSAQRLFFISWGNSSFFIMGNSAGAPYAIWNVSCNLECLMQFGVSHAIWGVSCNLERLMQ